MKTICSVIVGYGDRGRVYGKYAVLHPEQLKIVAVVDPSDMNRDKAKEDFHLPEDRCYRSVEEFIKAGKIADCVFNCTMDELHVSTTLPLLDAGYDVMLEKPVTGNPEELFQLKERAEKNRCRLVICHVLRYTPFYQGIKKALTEGRIGTIIAMEMSEYVGIQHVVTSYIRGKWRNSARSGSSILLAKSCHDLDLMCWLVGDSKPCRVASFGERTVFIPENAPAGAGNNCTVDCPVEKDCMYSAKKMYLEHNTMDFLTWAGMDTYFENVTEEQKEKHLQQSDFGKCVYKLDGDLYDHQTVSVEFENGVTASMNLISNATYPGRRIHIVGTKGEITGFLEENIYTIREFDADRMSYREEQFNVAAEVKSGHMGGDLRLVEDFVKLENGLRCSNSTTVIQDSVNGHLCVYAADRSAKEGRVVNLDEYGH